LKEIAVGVFSTAVKAGAPDAGYDVVAVPAKLIPATRCTVPFAARTRTVVVVLSRK
jgi:hypothetical protein